MRAGAAIGATGPASIRVALRAASMHEALRAASMHEALRTASIREALRAGGAPPAQGGARAV